MEQTEQESQIRSAFEAASFPVFACPNCKTTLQNPAPDLLHCPKEGISFERKDNIWRLMLPDRSDRYHRFIIEYETIRKAEGRASQNASYYGELPFQDLTGKFAQQWRIRSVTYQTFRREVLQIISKGLDRPLRIVDLGAGNGWLSNRLTQEGHRSVAVDLLTNNFDGLGACEHYPQPFVLVQAEFDRQPFADKSFDLAIFNASFHYSEDYHRTLEETLRVLDKDGLFVVLDSPIYRDPQSGSKMVEERERQFVEEYGFRSNALRSENYLTLQKMDELSRWFRLEWKQIVPDYGWRWRVKPLLAKLRGQREPARFQIVVGRKN